MVKDANEILRMRGGGHRRPGAGRGAPVAGGRSGRQPRRRSADRVPVCRRPRPCHAGGSAPRTAPSRPSWRPGRTRPSPTPGPAPAGSAPATRWWSTSAHLRRLPLGHDPHLLRRRGTDGELARVFRGRRVSAGRGGGSAPGADDRGGRPDLPQVHRRSRMGGAVRARHRARGGPRHPRGPSVGPGSTAILSPGAVITVEPGVYLPDTGGVRSRTPWW